jgi:hypothetical protein
MNVIGPNRPGAHPRGQGDRGEGVISTAIAVLIVAFLGAAMWIGFRSIWGDTEQNIRDQVQTIGN